jgi:hypothetical protein
VIRGLAEVGRPGPAREVADGGDVEAATGRLLSVAELQHALRTARVAAVPAGPAVVAMGTAQRTPAARDVPAVHLPTVGLPADPPARIARTGVATASVVAAARPSAVVRPDRAQRWVAVVGAHGGAGTSTVALALADAAAAGGQLVHLVGCGGPGGCGLLATATVELGVDRSGAWRTGRRGPHITVDRLINDVDDPLGGAPRWPDPPPTPGGVLTVVDTEPGAARTPKLLTSAGAVLLVCRVSVPGVQYTERLLGPLLELGRPVLVAALGGGRWPGSVVGATGALLRRLQADGRVVTVPTDRDLLTRGLTGRALPRPVVRAGTTLLALLAATGALSTPDAAVPTAFPLSPVPSGPGFLLAKDTSR